LELKIKNSKAQKITSEVNDNQTILVNLFNNEMKEESDINASNLCY